MTYLGDYIAGGIWGPTVCRQGHLKLQLITPDCHINSMFELTNMGEPSKIVSIKITQEEGSITIKQTKYIESTLKQEGMEHTNSVKTPLDPKQTIKPNPEGNKKSNAYACLIGSLQYLATATCPDIVFAVNRLSAFTANQSRQLLNAS